ncbi:MAG: sulfoxide reductase heme-binding subunit YedZ [Rhodospirillaceae bacterium]|nr:sulfoxide reductase heme-binding subunit YedZ [Rhodospirillaceae bacterium]
MSASPESKSATQSPENVRRFAERAVKPLVFVLACGPAGWLLYGALTNAIGPNPIEYIIRYCGDWALRFLLIALAVTPVRLLSGAAIVGRLRRMLGLFAFFYVCLHILAYVGLDQFFNWSAIFADVVKRVYITVGMAAFLTLVPMAATSTSGMMKRLGARRWRRLHRVVYFSAIAGIIHFLMMLKTGYAEPALYGVILTALLGIRALKKWP